jgi:type II secretory pathway component PulF
MVIPKISMIIVEAGGEIPVYTQIILGISNFLVDYGFILLGVLVVLGFFLFKYIQTKGGKIALDQFKLSVP